MRRVFAVLGSMVALLMIPGMSNAAGYYCNRERISIGSTFYYPNGKQVNIGSNYYYPNGSQANIGKNYYYPNGSQVNIGNNYYYPNGSQVNIGRNYYYPSGGQMNIGSTYYTDTGVSTDTPPRRVTYREANWIFRYPVEGGEINATAFSVEVRYPDYILTFEFNNGQINNIDAECLQGKN